MRKYIINYNLKPGKTEKTVFGSVAKACEFCKTLNESNIVFSMAVKDYEPEWHEIELDGPTDTLFEWLLKKANEDMYRNRDGNGIPYMATVNAEVFGKLRDRVWQDDCHFFLCVEKNNEYGDEYNYEWVIKESFIDVVTHKDDYCEVYEIIVDDDPELYEIIF